MNRYTAALVFRHLSLAFFVLASTVTQAQNLDKQNTDSAWQALREGKAVVLMRHALAPGTGDPASFILGDCTTQRNLSDEGRAQAIRIGEQLRANGVDSAKVYSSEWCRCMETAQALAIGEPQSLPVINSFFADRSTEPEQTRSLRELIKQWAAVGGDARVLVTHQVNISALTGQYAGSGDMVFVTVDHSDITVLAQIVTDL